MTVNYSLSARIAKKEMLKGLNDSEEEDNTTTGIIKKFKIPFHRIIQDEDNITLDFEENDTIRFLKELKDKRLESLDSIDIHHGHLN